MKWILCLTFVLGVAGCGFQHAALWDTPPRVVFEPAVEFSVKVRYVEVRLLVEANGTVANVEVVREPLDSEGEPLGHVVDQEIVALVKKYKFRPATAGGRPIAAELYMEINSDYF